MTVDEKLLFGSDMTIDEKLLFINGSDMTVGENYYSAVI